MNSYASASLQGILTYIILYCTSTYIANLFLFILNSTDCLIHILNPELILCPLFSLRFFL